MLTKWPNVVMRLGVVGRDTNPLAMCAIDIDVVRVRELVQATVRDLLQVRGFTAHLSGALLQRGRD